MEKERENSLLFDHNLLWNTAVRIFFIYFGLNSDFFWIQSILNTHRDFSQGPKIKNELLKMNLNTTKSRYNGLHCISWAQLCSCGLLSPLAGTSLDWDYCLMPNQSDNHEILSVRHRPGLDIGNRDFMSCWKEFNRFALIYILCC